MPEWVEDRSGAKLLAASQLVSEQETECGAGTGCAGKASVKEKAA